MRIIAFIEDAKLIQVILKHLGLWDTNNHGPPNLNSSHTANELTVDKSYSQIPQSDLDKMKQDESQNAAILTSLITSGKTDS